MRQDIQKKWVEALRSGDYSQGKGKLKDASGDYCCLGVLCELAVEAGVLPKPLEIGPESVDGPSYLYGSENTGSLLPREVSVWAGLSDNSPQVRDEHNQLPLTYLNDTGHDFETIAELIEKQGSDWDGL